MKKSEYKRFVRAHNKRMAERNEALSIDAKSETTYYIGIITVALLVIMAVAKIVRMYFI